MKNARFILPTSWHPTREDFLSALRIRSEGLAAQLFEIVYDSFFDFSIDIKREYERYYSVEYSTLGEYINTRYGKEFSEEELERDRVLLIEYFPQVIDTDYEGNMLDAVLECIEKMEHEHEG